MIRKKINPHDFAKYSIYSSFLKEDMASYIIPSFWRFSQTSSQATWADFFSDHLTSGYSTKTSDVILWGLRKLNLSEGCRIGLDRKLPQRALHSHFSRVLLEKGVHLFSHGLNMSCVAVVLLCSHCSRNS